ncbi:MAG: hypothetical protein K0R54_1052 [Clostridiaceae bacterium]|jgi:hypothetical protein|nr:hypothetical protein [Clostridiaceae bacterium]
MNKDNKPKSLHKKEDINKLINFLNTFDYKEYPKTIDKKTKPYDYRLLLCKEPNNLATNIEFSDQYIRVNTGKSSKIYNGNSDINSYFEKMYYMDGK